MIAYVHMPDGTWSIARLDLEDGLSFEWWCGEKDEWVSPGSGWWQLVPSCYNETYPTLDAAKREVRKRKLDPVSG